MKRLRTVCVIVGALIALLAVGIALILVLIPGTDLLRKNVEEQLTRLTGSEVHLDSVKLSWSFPRLVHISLGKVSIRTREGEQILSAEKVVCSPVLTSLIRGEVFIESLSLERFHARMSRTADGQIRLPFVPVPGPSRPVAAPDERPEPTASGLPQPDQSAPARPQTGLRWSVKEVSLADSRIDWVDAYAARGQEIVVPIRNIRGRLSRTDSTQGFAFMLFANVGGAKPGDNEVQVDGSVLLGADDSGPQQVQVSVSAESFDLGPFSVYIPKDVALVREMPIKAIRGRFSWEKGRAPLVSAQAELWEGSEKGGRVRLQGQMTLSADLSSVEKATFGAETDSFGLKLVAKALPSRFPLDAEIGLLKGRINGEWTRADDWTVEGALVLEEVTPRKPFHVLGKGLRVSAEVTLQPRDVVIRSLEIAESAKIASISGKISEPFSGKPTLDLKGEIDFNPRWPEGSGLHLPDGLRIGGSFPVRGTVKGSNDDLRFDMAGDLTGVPISWGPYLEKPRGQKASVSAKGRFLPTGGRASGPARLDAATRLELVGAGLRLAPETKPLSPSSVNLAFTVLVDGKKVLAKNGALAIRKGSEGKDFLTAKGGVTDIGSSEPVIDAEATVTVSPELLVFTGLDSSHGLSVKGNAPLRTTFSGPLSRLNWSLEMPVDSLDIGVGNHFRKPGEVKGTLKASGKVITREVTLDAGTLSLPGVNLAGRGLLRDRNGKTGTLTFDLKKGDFDKLLKYFPQMSAKGLSGPVEATFTLMPSQERLVPAGSVKLMGVNYRPEKADWSVGQIKGTLDVKDDSLVIPEMVGRVAGALEGPLRVSGSLKEITSLETVQGTVSISMGEGKIVAERLRAILEPTRILVGTILDPALGRKSPDFLGFSYLTGDFRVASGTVSSDNIHLKGTDLTAGAMGSLRVDSLQIDVVAGLHTMVVGGEALGKIPAVRDFLKKHEEVLKATGIDKELKRWGITPPDKKADPAEQQDATKTPVTVFLKIRGPLDSPQVSPLLETALEKNTLSRLKALIH